MSDLPRNVPSGGGPAIATAQAVKTAPVGQSARPRPRSFSSSTLLMRLSTIPTHRKRAPFSSPCERTYTPDPASPFVFRTATPIRKMPAWLIVEYASSRFRCRWRKHIVAPSSAPSVPKPSRIARKPGPCVSGTDANTVQYTRATP